MRRNRCSKYFAEHLVVALCVLMLGGFMARAGEASVSKRLMKHTRAIMLGPKLKIRPGEWVAYQMCVSGEQVGMGSLQVRLKVSIPVHADIEHPLKPGQYWVEFEFSEPGAQQQYPALVFKMLVAGDPRDPGAVKAAYIRSGNRVPMILPLKDLQTEDTLAPACAKGDGESCAKKGGRVRNLGKKKVYTNMGWIQTDHVRVVFPKTDQPPVDYWISSRVPIFGLVRISWSAVMEFELDSYGTGALSRIDESKAVPLPDSKGLRDLVEGSE
jgi:hypothetical protein